jgi:hypothetical protein
MAAITLRAPTPDVRITNPGTGLVATEWYDFLRQFPGSVRAGAVYPLTRSTAIGSDLSNFVVGDRITTTAFATVGDGGGGTYEKIATAPPANAGYFTSADGSFWRLVPPEINVLQFGAKQGSPGGSIFSTAAINDAITFCNLNNEIGILSFGHGQLFVVDAPLTPFTKNIELRGSPSTFLSGSILMKQYVEADPIRGMLTFGVYMPKIIRLGISVHSPLSSGGSLMTMINPTDTSSVGSCMLDGMSCAGGNGVNYNLYVDGSANAAGGGGARNFFLSNCVFFGTNILSVFWKSVRNVNVSNTIIDTAGGAGGALQITGTPAVISGNIAYNGMLNSSHFEFVTGLWVYGNIANNTTVNDADEVQVHGNVGGNLDLANTNHVQVHGRITGAVTSTVPATINNTRLVGEVVGALPAWNATNKVYI